MEAFLLVRVQELEVVVGPGLVVVRLEDAGAREVLVALHPWRRGPGAGQEAQRPVGGQGLTGVAQDGHFVEVVLLGERESAERRVAGLIMEGVDAEGVVRAADGHAQDVVLDAIRGEERPDELFLCTLRQFLYIYTSRVGNGCTPSDDGLILFAAVDFKCDSSVGWGLLGEVGVAGGEPQAGFGAGVEPSAGEVPLPGPLQGVAVCGVANAHHRTLAVVSRRAQLCRLRAL